KALTWFRAIRTWVSDWDSLVAALREEFQPPDYDRKLFEEIKSRTQGPNESIGMYLAVMGSLFSRLNVSIPEDTKLKIILENIDPFYQPHLAFVEISTVSQLLTYCRMLDAKRHTANSFVPPPRKSKSLEPDLAYVYETAVVNSKPKVDVQGISPNINCWNCGENHYAKSCIKPRENVYCFTCGNKDFTAKTFPKCARTGNGQTRRD